LNVAVTSATKEQVSFSSLLLIGIALEWTDIDFRRSLLHVNRSEWEGQVGTPKGGRSRTVPMTARLHDALKVHRQLKGPRVLYSDDRAWPIATRSQAGSGERSAGQGSRSPAGCIMRHTFCSRLAMRGAIAKAIQELAGHANLSTTQRYMHLSPAAKESAIRALELPLPGGERGETTARQ
jgi:integrase